jgi:hypothetical protein
MMLAVGMLLALTGCGREELQGELEITLGKELVEYTKGEDMQEGPVAGPEGPGFSGKFSFTYNGVELVPGDSFDASRLPEALSVYQVPSCALVGTDNLYNYDTFEVTAFNDGTGEFIYSIYFIDPNMTTPEGLALGDSLDKAVGIYGSGYADEAGECVYTNEQTQLRLIVQNDVVVSIEYRLVT